MLRELRIKNFAILPETTVTFKEGLNVLTGETGAGKSLLVDAIGLLAGARASTEDVRTGEEMAVVEGSMDLPSSSPVWMYLKDTGVPVDGTELVLRRTIAADGRSRVYANGWQWTVAGLTQLSEYWIDISGQHGHHSLLDEETHVDLLDSFGGHMAERSDYSKAYSRVTEIDRRLAEYRKSRAEAERQREYLEFQLKELTEANLVEGEDEEVTTRHRRLANVGKLSAAAKEIEEALSGEAGAETLVGRALQVLRGVGRFDESLTSWQADLEQTLVQLRDLSERSSDYLRKLEFEPGEMERVEDRLAVLQRVIRKFGSIPRAIEEREKARSLLGSLVDGENIEADLERERSSAIRELLKSADVLSSVRKKNGKRMSDLVSKELHELGMPAAEIRIRFESSGPELVLGVGDRNFGPRGAETAQFEFAPNPGEGLRPMSKIASGGELSRVHLAIKGIAWREKKSSGITYLFDEVDTGIGGETAERVGIRLASLAKGRQALCVTHLPQIACYGNAHLRVEKETRSGRTVARVTELRREERKEELARMLGGIKISKNALSHAEELLSRAPTSF